MEHFMMRTPSLFISAAFALALTACVVVSPESGGTSSATHGSSVASLQYLVNGPRVGGEVDDELMKHGFTQTATDVAGDQAWGYYRNAATGECAIVHFDAQRVVKSVAQGNSSCKP
jgi:hypothetical protein